MTSGLHRVPFGPRRCSTLRTFRCGTILAIRESPLCHARSSWAGAVTQRGTLTSCLPSYLGTMQFKKALRAFRRALEIVPDHPVPLVNLVVVENRICDWTLRTEHHGSLRSRIAKGEIGNSFPPFHAFELSGVSGRHKHVACLVSIFMATHTLWLLL